MLNWLYKNTDLWEKSVGKLGVIRISLDDEEEKMSPYYRISHRFFFQGQVSLFWGIFSLCGKFFFITYYIVGSWLAGVGV